MHSFRPIPIHSKNDSQNVSSRSIDPHSWKLEKNIDERGKSNYKLVSDNRSFSDNIKHRSYHRKHKIQHKTIGAYGVPGSSAYMNPSMSSGLMRGIRKVKKNDSLKNIQDISDVSKTFKNDAEITIERYAENEDLISKNMLIGNNNKLLNYTNGNDLLHKSFQHSHLLSNDIYLQKINLLISYFGNDKIPYMSISIWSQTFSPSIELINITSIPIQNIEKNFGKLISKEINSEIVTKGQLFLTINCPDEYQGKFNIKYNIEMTQIFTNLKEIDINFEYPTNEEKPVVNEMPSTNKNTFPLLSKGGIFKELNTQQKPKKTTNQKKIDEQSASLGQSIYANQAKKAAGMQSSFDQEEVDFTEKDDTDINKILNILRNQSCQN